MKYDGLFRLEGFEKIVVKPSARGGSKKCTEPMVKIVSGGKNVRYLSINGAAMSAAGFKPGDRLDLYANGKTFAFEKSPAGLYTVRKQGAKSDTGIIGSQNLCREVAVRAKNAKEFNATAMAGILFFEAIDSEE